MRTPDTADALLSGARAAAAEGRDGDVLTLAAQAAALAKAAGDLRLEAEAQSLQTTALLSQARTAEAVALGLRALASWRVAGDVACECRQLRVLGTVLTEHGLHVQAMDMARQSFDLAEAHGLAPAGGLSMALVGTLCGRLGEYDTGESLLMQALSRMRDLNDKAGSAQVRGSLLGLLETAHRAYRDAGDNERADAVARRMLVIARQLLAHSASEGQPFRRAIQLGNVAGALTACGLLAEASERLLESQALCRAGGYGLVQLRNHSRLADVHTLQGHWAAAAAELDAMAALLSGVPNAQAAEDLAIRRCELAHRQGDAVAARRHEADAGPMREQREREADALHSVLAEHAASLPERLQMIERWRSVPPIN